MSGKGEIVAGKSGSIPHAMLFTFSLGYAALYALSAWLGGWALLAPPLVTLGGSSLADRWLPRTAGNPAQRVSAVRLRWHQGLLLLWVPIQLFMIFGSLAAIFLSDRFNAVEAIGMMLCVGVGTGTFGVVYAHELMHRGDKISSWASEILLVSVLYGHFITEHLRVHHRYVGTPRDAVTSRYGETLYRFLGRAVLESFRSAWVVEAGRQRQRQRSPYVLANPFWRYGGGALLCLAAAGWIGGGYGILLFLVQAIMAIFLTESINYIQHYGLTRKHLGDGRYERTREHHSWNAPLPVTSLMLINLQRHSDHHFKPDRPYPLLQTFPEETAPRLPYGYPVMVGIALVPRLWRVVMNRKVRHWRAAHYPEITDWTPYNSMALPMPR